MYVDVKELPDFVRSALKEVGYGSRDISVEVREKYFVGDAGSAGRKSFCIVIDGQNGNRRITWGSWGGANMFNPRNQVDLDGNIYPLPLDGIVIHGSIGGNGTYASITVHPQNVNRKLLTAPAEITGREQSILRIFGFKSGYRKEELSRMNVTETEISALIDRGFIEQNKVGRKLTIKGKNAKSAY